MRQLAKFLIYFSLLSIFFRLSETIAFISRYNRGVLSTNMREYIYLTPELIQWAVGYSDLSLEEIYRRYPVLSTDAPKFTLKQLQEFAKYIRAPFVNLFLGTIPEEEPLPIPDFRTKSDKIIKKPSLNLQNIIWVMEKRRGWMREYLISQQADTIPFIGSLANTKNPVTVTQKIREYLNIDIDWQKDLPSSDNALKHLREKIEELGVMVFLESGLNNTPRCRFDPEEFRGFVLLDDIAPLLFINSADSPTAQLFTLLHEFVHLCFGVGGLFDFEGDNDKEKLCNNIAAEILVPKTLFLSQWKMQSGNIPSIARFFKVSSLVIARRARDCRLISSDSYGEFCDKQKEEGEMNKDGKSSGGNFYNTKLYQLSQNFCYSVIIAVQHGNLMFRDAFSLLGLSGKTFDTFSAKLTGGNK